MLIPENKNELKIITIEEIKQHESLTNITEQEALYIIDFVKK